MEYETYMADDGTIHTRPVQRASTSGRPMSLQDLILRDDGTIHRTDHSRNNSTVQNAGSRNNAAVQSIESPVPVRQPMTLFGKILTGIMMTVCLFGIILFPDLKCFYRFYKGSGLARFFLWTLPVIIFIMYYLIHLYKERKNKVIDSWFCAGMVTMAQSLLIWLGAGDHLGALAGWFLIGLASCYLFFLIFEEADMQPLLKGTMVASFCVFFLPCIIISGSLCGGNMNRIYELNGVLKFVAVLPAFVETGIATAMTVKWIRLRH